jgi:hypothetical protein
MKLNDQTVSILCKALESGLSVVACCGIAGISESTFYRWRKDHDEFQIAIQASQYNFEVNAIEAIKRAGDKDWRAWAWLLERRFPKSWKNYQEVNIVTSQNDGTSVVIGMLEQIAKRDGGKVAKVEGVSTDI